MFSRSALALSTPYPEHHQPPTAANRQPLFNHASLVLCLVYALTLKQRASP